MNKTWSVLFFLSSFIVAKSDTYSLQKCADYFTPSTCSTLGKPNTIVHPTATCSSATCQDDEPDSSTCCVDPPQTCGESTITCPRGYARVADKLICQSATCQEKECCVLGQQSIQIVSTATSRFVEPEDVCIASGRCQAQSYEGKQSITTRPAAVTQSSFSLPFTAVGQFQSMLVGNAHITLDVVRGQKTTIDMNDLTDDVFMLFDEQQQQYTLSDINQTTPTAKLVCKEEPWISIIGNGLDQKAPKRCVIRVPRPLPCWIREVAVRIWGRIYRFPVLGWSRRCCGERTGVLGWYSNATGCFQGVGPFLSESQ
jgi:hypothetical protein